ncbi:hypothetical protein [Verrucomicrobium sp. BvORR034]|uniref:hypothetical protein n=1 Tax=Verrucomicrobium sp. BvORR034 TaxID=1396418 RepID=UPI0006799935|nr:hypothetical protein [Verrucomicrobium sp. BvORR034]
MPSPDNSRFAPGFRFSWTDAFVLILGAGLIWWLAGFAGELALLAAFVIGHFFLFCNVFRIDRKPELVWAGAFIVLAALSLGMEWLDLRVALGLALGLSISLILQEMRLPRYHGVFWKWVNPGLPEWWRERGEQSYTSREA